MAWVFVILFAVIVVRSLSVFVLFRDKTESGFADTRFSLELFVTLLMIYVTVIIGFGAIYFILSLKGVVLVEHNELKRLSVIGSILHSMYFSGVTMLTIGYGDIVPVGIGRLIAIVQALIGYVLPAAFVLKIVQASQYERSR
ncbi:Protein LctB [Lentibacillus sp. JNUCC-1]|uniref:potassium channel family protein n=1 Tax=Lentibacillus sp. JNUCC-1 TaxID=2654513 RepID=UPI0012E96949|nr:potassium channel family protein [Lentibacillus sp. JNUCC-1]MUV38715.1 Protein LctB [Lentibacillus sp. JNUCC-1]